MAMTLGRGAGLPGKTGPCRRGGNGAPHPRPQPLGLCAPLLGAALRLLPSQSLRLNRRSLSSTFLAS